jgi:hypothetical protein
MGETIMIVGKATMKAKLLACNQRLIKFVTRPRLKKLITKDIIPDINNAIKNEKTNL